MDLFPIFLFSFLFGIFGAKIPEEQSFSRNSLQCLNTTIDGQCKEYYFVDTFGEWNWSASREYCYSLVDFLGYEMDLVAIETKTENDVLKEYLNQAYPGEVVDFWTGGFDPTGTKNYFWLSTGVAAQFYDWEPEQPNGGPGDDVIHFIHNQSNTAGWGDYPKSRTAFPLCERVRVDWLQCLNTTIGGGCKEYYFGDTTMNWTSARLYCQNLTDYLGYEMDLVAIETKKENEVLLEYLVQKYLVNTDFWTGGHDPIGYKNYQWVSTGYVAQFYDWFPGQPNGGPEDDVIYMSRDPTGWGDLEQSSLLIPLCERVSIN